MTCEGYVFEVCRAPKKRPEREQDRGAIVTRVFECFKALYDATPPAPSDSASRAEWHEWCCSAKESMLDYLADNPVYDCQLAEKLARFVCPDPAQFQTDAQYRAAVRQSVTGVAPVRRGYLRYASVGAAAACRDG